VVFFEKKDQSYRIIIYLIHDNLFELTIFTCVIAGHLQFIEHPVGFPNPMVLGLGKLRLPIVPIEVGVHGIVAIGDQCSDG